MHSITYIYTYYTPHISYIYMDIYNIYIGAGGTHIIIHRYIHIYTYYPLYIIFLTHINITHIYTAPIIIYGCIYIYIGNWNRINIHRSYMSIVCIYIVYIYIYIQLEAYVKYIIYTYIQIHLLCVDIMTF